MLDKNQGGATNPTGSDPVLESKESPPDLGPEPPAESAYESSANGAAPTVAVGLSIWLLALLVLGVGGLLFGMQELSALMALAGLFVVAQAADMDERWKPVNLAVSWVPSVFGGIAFILLGVAVIKSEAVGSGRALAIGFSFGAGVLSLLAALPWFANGLVAALFRSTRPSHTLRLSARLAMLCLLLVVPGWFAFRYLLQDLFQDPQPMLDRKSLGSGLVGYVAVALAAVGLQVRRNLAQTIERLGLRSINPAHLAVVLIGLVTLVGLNTGADWLQRTLFPGLWESDQRITKAIAQDLPWTAVLLLGLSAGVGEEITLRGALQPKLGIVLTALLFAVLHVQYSWFGMAVIFLFGILLGVIRKQSSTTVAILIHVLYDIAAVFAVTRAE